MLLYTPALLLILFSRSLVDELETTYLTFNVSVEIFQFINVTSFIVKTIRSDDDAFLVSERGVGFKF